MPQYKLELIDGTTIDLTAHRVVADDSYTIFENPGNPSPSVVHRVPSNQVAGVQRRIVEISGLVRWVTALPGPATLTGGAW